MYGPAHTNSVTGFRCYVLFIDEFPKYTWLFPLLNKSDAFETFWFFKLQIEILLSLKIKKFQTDGGEYISSRFQSLLSESEIVHQVSYPFTPEQNGCAERKHRHVVETGLGMHFTTHLPTTY